MTTIAEVTQHLDRVFRPELQEAYDNAGFLLGEAQAEYRGALVALDLTEAVADEAIALGLNLIVTHHPFIFSGLKRVTDLDATGRLVYKLVRHGIAVYAAHTNLDSLAWGVNGPLASRLGLRDAAPLHRRDAAPDACEGLVASLPSPMPTADFLALAKARLGLPVIRHGGLCRPQVQRVALCGGAGAFLIRHALALGADIFLTADLKYHDFQLPEGRMVLADIGHYESEQFAKETICHTISEKFCNFACQISTAQTGLVEYI